MSSSSLGRPLLRGYKQVAEYTGINERLLRRLVERDFPSVVVGRLRFFDRDSVDVWINSHRRSGQLATAAQTTAIQDRGRR